MQSSGEFSRSESFLPRGNLLTVSKLLDGSEILSPRKLSGSSSEAYSPAGSVNEPAIDNYSDESEQNADMDSMRSGESIIKNYIFDNTKYNPNTMKCISFWRALKDRPDLKPCPCDFSFENQSKISMMEYNSKPSPNSETQSLGQTVTWYDALLELQKRKMDQVAFAATFQSCRLCERDEPYAKFKRKMGQNYSDSELNDYEDLTCLNCWTSHSIKRDQEAAEAAKNKAESEEVTRIIFMNSCACQETESKKCTCSKDLHNSRLSEVSDQDSSNPEIAYTTHDFNPTRICSESGEGDSLSVFPKVSCSRGKDYYDNLKRFQNLENPSGAGSNIIMEEAEVEQEAENCDCRSCNWSSCGDVEKKSIPGTEDELSNFPSLADDETNFSILPLTVEDPSLGGSSVTKPTKSPTEKMHLQYKPGCCFGCGILSCVCTLCEPAASKPLAEKTTDPVKDTKKIPVPKKVRLENFDKFLKQCEKCGVDCNCWKNKVDHAKQYLEDLKQMMKENETYDKACGTEDSEEDVSSTKSVNICIICGHKNCDCKYARGRPSLYFETVELGSNQPQTTTFAQVFNEKLKSDESRISGLDQAQRQPSGVSVNMEKLKTISLKHRAEKPIIKDCKNKLMVTPAQKAYSIIKNNINLVLQKDLYGIPHVTRYPDKRPILKPSEDDESYSSQPESSYDDTEAVHDLEPWYCTEKPKEEEPEITYGRKL